jgi:lysyl-tRNA synthetase, class II
MSEKISERDVRIQKTQTLRAIGINPYAQSWDKNTSIGDLSSQSPLIRGGAEGGGVWGEGGGTPDGFKWHNLRIIEEIIASPTTNISIAGRIMLKRVSGKLAFWQIMDETGQIQLMWEHQSSKLLGAPLLSGEAGVRVKELMWESNKPFDYWFIDKFLDVGDIIGVRGELFVTHKGELTIFVSEYQLLSKAIRPLGDKFHGIGEDNQETAYRQRYLDMIFNRESLERMKFRSHFIRTLREFYWKHDFLELDCPVLTPAASWAAAQPFVTHHNDFDKDYYLRICNETELKKATVWWMEKVFTIATIFRNEGSDPSHLQEFAMLEHQNAYRSFREDMNFTQDMFDHIFNTLKLDREFEVKDKMWNPKMVNFTSPWPRIDYVEWVNKASWLDITSYSIDDADKLRNDIKSKGIEFEWMDQMGTMTLIDYLYKKVLRPTITGPAFIYNYPSIIAPLARISDEDPRKCEKWQVVVNWWEIINSYGELVDPVRQMENFAEQSKAEEWGDTEATSADFEFVKAMEYGMPIQAWFGMWIDRIIAILTQQDNLRDVVMFPLMKPEII